MDGVHAAPARGPADWHAAAGLLGGYRRWLAATTGLELTAAQSTALAEFEDLRSFYRRPHGVLLVARVDGRAAGLVGVHHLDGAVGELKRMYVTPPARGRGAGRVLVDAAVAAAGELGWVSLVLQTDPAVMGVADRLYRAAGFVDAAPYADLGVDGVVTLRRDVAGSPAAPVRSQSTGSAGR